MGDRPLLNERLDSTTFRSYYYLKEELTDFCKKVGLPTTGAKIELTDIIAHFLDTGEMPSKVSMVRKSRQIGFDKAMTLSSVIESNYVCTEEHRAFFKKEIGNRFSFHVAFQKWLKGNAGKTYKEAVEAYFKIQAEKKKSKTTIDKQFEYNTYIRDFFTDNNGRSLKDAIRCWKYKKEGKGHNRYEKSDLTALH